MSALLLLLHAPVSLGATLTITMGGAHPACSRQGLAGKLLRAAGALNYADERCISTVLADEEDGWVGADARDCGRRGLDCFLDAPAPPAYDVKGCRGRRKPQRHGGDPTVWTGSDDAAWSACPQANPRDAFGADARTNDVWPPGLPLGKQAELVARLFRLRRVVADAAAGERRRLADAEREADPLFALAQGAATRWIACHVRRGDKTASAGSGSAAEGDVEVFERRYVPALLRAAAKHRTRRVFLATDGAALAAHAAGGQRADGLHISVSASATRGHWNSRAITVNRTLATQEALVDVELLACGRTAFFVGSRTSAFSKVAMLLLRHRDPDVGVEWPRWPTDNPGGFLEYFNETG